MQLYVVLNDTGDTLRSESIRYLFYSKLYCTADTCKRKRGLNEELAGLHFCEECQNYRGKRKAEGPMQASLRYK